MRLRRDRAAMLDRAGAQARIGSDAIHLIRWLDGHCLVARLDLPGAAAPAASDAVILDWTGPDGCRVSLVDAGTGRGPIDN